MTAPRERSVLLSKGCDRLTEEERSRDLPGLIHLKMQVDFDSNPSWCAGEGRSGNYGESRHMGL